MKKNLLSLLLFSSILFSKEVVSSKENIIELMNKGYTIVDIRNYREWEKTGVIPKAKTIMFFKENGEYNVSVFLAKLKLLNVNINKIALISTNGEKSKEASNAIKKEAKINVIDLVGGYNNLRKN